MNARKNRRRKARARRRLRAWRRARWVSFSSDLVLEQQAMGAIVRCGPVSIGKLHPDHWLAKVGMGRLR